MEKFTKQNTHDESMTFGMHGKDGKRKKMIMKFDSLLDEEV